MQNSDEFFCGNLQEQNLEEIKRSESIDESIQEDQMKMTPRKRQITTIFTQRKRSGFQANVEEAKPKHSDDSDYSYSSFKHSEDELSDSEKNEEMYFSEEFDCQSNVKQSKRNQKSEKKERKKKLNSGEESKQQNRVQSKGKNQKQKNSNRKVRKTITPALLKSLNELFKQYDPHKKCTLYAFQGPSHLFSLKSIGQYLNLGYSTILHKYRQFRAHNEVRGGALIAAIDNKRKYRKSIEIEQLIEKALKKRSFCSAVEMCTYLLETHSIKLSRSIISRHLVSMGYSFRHSNKSYKDGFEKIKAIRFKYLNFISSLIHTKKSNVYYLSEYEFSFAASHKDEFQMNKGDSSTDLSGVYSVIALVSFGSGITHFDIQRTNHTEEQSRFFLYDIVTSWQGQSKENSHIVVMDLKENHRSTQMLKFRDQIRNSNIIFAYLPPYSQKLNFADYIFSKIQSEINTLKVESSNDSREILEACLQRYFNRPLQAEAEEIREVLQLAAKKQEITNDELI